MKDAILSFLKSYALKALAGLSGFQATLASFALKFGWKYVERFIGTAINKIKSAWGYFLIQKKHETDVKNAEKYEEALKGGDTDNATDDLLNGNK